MILNDVNARSISRVPDTDAGVPAAWHEQIWHLGIPQKCTDPVSVSVEYPYCSTVLCVIPHPYSATIKTSALFHKAARPVDFLNFKCWPKSSDSDISVVPKFKSGRRSSPYTAVSIITICCLVNQCVQKSTTPVSCSCFIVMKVLFSFSAHSEIHSNSDLNHSVLWTDSTDIHYTVLCSTMTAF